MMPFLQTNWTKWQRFRFVCGRCPVPTVSETPTLVTEGLCGLPWSFQVNVDVASKMVVMSANSISFPIRCLLTIPSFVAYSLSY
jgi:hypothetical protein